jgi:peptidoglycan/LPS O-acetylase OafA/YrhL
MEKPLLHTWSLSVEEQYYLLFPALMLIGWKHGRAHVLKWLITIALLSLVAAELTHRLADPELSYFMTTGRVWELLLGALLAFRSDQLADATPRWLKEVAAVAGLVLIGIAVMAFDKNTPSPGLYMLVPTIGTVLVLAYARKGTWTAWILGLWPLAAIGVVRLQCLPVASTHLRYRTCPVAVRAEQPPVRNPWFGLHCDGRHQLLVGRTTVPQAPAL